MAAGTAPEEAGTACGGLDGSLPDPLRLLVDDLYHAAWWCSKFTIGSRGVDPYSQSTDKRPSVVGRRDYRTFQRSMSSRVKKVPARINALQAQVDQIALPRGSTGDWLY